MDCATWVSSLVSIIDFPGVPLFLHVQHRRHHFLHTQHFPPQHLPKDHLKSRAGHGLGAKTGTFQNNIPAILRASLGPAGQLVCRPSAPAWFPVLFCVTLGEVGVVRTADRSDKPNKPAPVATAPLGPAPRSLLRCVCQRCCCWPETLFHQEMQSGLPAPLCRLRRTKRSCFLWHSAPSRGWVTEQIASQTLINARPFVKGRSANLIKWN